MPTLSSVLLACALLGPQDASATADEPAALPELPARAKLDGVGSLIARSRIVFKAAPDRPHILETTYVFPQRARWWLGIEGDDLAGRLLRYRYGDTMFGIAPGQSESNQLLGLGAIELERQVELRKALFMWPHGYEWQEVGVVRVADLGAAGSLVANLGEGGRPNSMSSLDAEGKPKETLTGIEWKVAPRTRKDREPRTWPHRMRLLAEGGVIWDEEVLAVETGTRFVDAYFVPPDRRRLAPRMEIDGTVPLSVDLPASTERRVALRAGLSLADAITFADERNRAEAADLAAAGFVLARYPVIEFDPAGRPTTLIQRLVGAPDPPKGWERIPSRPAVSLILPTTREVKARTLGLLRDSAGEGAKLGSAYGRVEPAGSTPRRVQLLVPLIEKP